MTALGTNSITLKSRDGSTTPYITSPTSTTYFEGTTAGVVGDLAVGEQVSLELSTTTPQIVTKVTIRLERISGSVTAVAGDVITLSAFHGTTFTVTVVPGTTTYTSGGAASSLTAVVVGVKISALGLPGTAADSLTANSVNIGVAHDHVTDFGHGQSQSHNQGSGQGSGKGFGQGHGHGRH